MAVRTADAPSIEWPHLLRRGPCGSALPAPSSPFPAFTEAIRPIGGRLLPSTTSVVHKGHTARSNDCHKRRGVEEQSQLSPPALNDDISVILYALCLVCDRRIRAFGVDAKSSQGRFDYCAAELTLPRQRRKDRNRRCGRRRPRRSGAVLRGCRSGRSRRCRARRTIRAPTGRSGRAPA